MPRSLYSLLGLSVLICALAPASAGAATINVNTTADEFTINNGVCSLREAVSVTNNDAAGGGCPTGTGDDVIVLPAGNYVLTRVGEDNTNVAGDLDVIEDETLSIVGTGTVAIRGGGTDRVIDHYSGGGDLEITNVTISDGNLAGINDGGGVLNRSGDLTVQNSTLRGNRGAVDGGGIANYDTATLINVTVSGNSTFNDGGGLYGAGGSVTALRNVTVAYNTADGNMDGTGDGGGIAGSGTINTFNTIIGDNLDDSAPAAQTPDCATGPGFFPRYTLIERFDAATCLIAFDPGTNITGQDPRLQTLGLNGGSTPTHSLREGSPAIDAGGQAPPDECEPMDQRGVVRPQRAACDLGAFELPPVPPVVRCGGRRATIVGTVGRNVLRGTPGPDVIAALGGADTVRGLGGKDLICGGKGNDRIDSGAGNDTLLGQIGADTLRGAAGRDLLKGGPGRDRLFGGAGRDRLVGGPGRDQLRGGAGRDIARQ